MKDDLRLLEEKALVYFDSINDLFNYRIKNYWKYNFVFGTLVISIIFLFFNIFPIIPALRENYLSFLIKLINEHLFLIPKTTFWTRWLAGTSLSLIIFLCILPFSIRWDNNIGKKSAPDSILDFCYLFTARKELNNYIINERPEHLIKANKYIKKVTYYLDKIKIGEKDDIKINAIIEIIKKKNNWFSVDSNTQEYLNAFTTLQNKVFERINQHIAINELLPVVDWLTLYEYSKIKPNELNHTSIHLIENADLYFAEFIKEVNALSPIDVPIADSVKSKNRIKNIINKFFTLFSNDSIILMFFSWLFVFSLIFAIGAISVFKYFDLTIDTTFLIGILTAPFIGAITFSAAIFSKNRK